ncbi:MAG: ribosome silencing factor [Chloroflexi bacterium]|nr:MAG: ribosome silencing factor [Chloroflexota bacterium]
MEVSTLEPVELARIIVDLASDKKGEDIVLMDMRPVSPMADFFVIVSGTSGRQLKAIIDHIGQEVKETHHIRPWRVEGEPNNGWVLIDFGDVVVHVFLPEKRAYYDLEGLWREAPVMVRMQ